MPSDPTLRRVLQPVDPESVDAVFSAWLDTETRWVGDALAIDGKSLRSSAHGARRRPVPRLAGIAPRTGQVLGQVEVAVKCKTYPQTTQDRQGEFPIVTIGNSPVSARVLGKPDPLLYGEAGVRTARPREGDRPEECYRWNNNDG